MHARAAAECFFLQHPKCMDHAKNIDVFHVFDDFTSWNLGSIRLYWQKLFFAKILDAK
jgi:hypothetical protein